MGKKKQKRCECSKCCEWRARAAELRRDGPSPGRYLVLEQLAAEVRKLARAGEVKREDLQRLDHLACIGLGEP